MKLPGPPLPQRHLQPGELLVTKEPVWVLTLLGSCVAVTMFSARFRLAAICHGMLPQPNQKPPQTANSPRYLSYAIPAMAEPFSRAGLAPHEVEVKLFGGANVIQLGGESPGERAIGSINIVAANRLLAATGFKVKAYNVGGQSGCKIWFNTQTGKVLYRSLARPAHTT